MAGYLGGMVITCSGNEGTVVAGARVFIAAVCCRPLTFGECGECGRRLWLVPRVGLGLARDGASFGCCGVLWVQPGRLVFQSPREM